VTLIPSLAYPAIIFALERDGWRVERQRGSHIRLSKVAEGRLRKLTVPAHKPVKRSTLAKVIKQANLTIDEFLKLL
jgi:predicted RNA binding protein YcfA (HicA-like mRNA interferase family)